MIIINAFRFILITVSLAILAWVSVHVLAFFGVFLAVGYLIWWVFFPNYRICLMCLFKEKGQKCVFCRKDKIWASLIFDFILILVFSGMSIGIVFAENYALPRLGIIPAQKTVSFIISPKGQYRIGEIIPLKIEISGIKTPVNSVQADIGFDPTAVSVVDISTEGSFANIFIQKEINNDGGWARLTGGLPNPGYFSDHGFFGTVYFQAKKSGLTTVKFLGSSMVLANDGRGSSVLKDFPSASYFIIPEKISAEEESMQLNLIAQTPNPVLGIETNQGIEPGAQLKFFSDSKPNVLGAESILQPNSPPKSNILVTFANWVMNMDSVLIDIYKSILF